MGKFLRLVGGKPYSIEESGGGAGEALPVGTILAFAGTTLPTGFLWCDGAAVSRTTYANLYTAIGVSHGYGDNSTTFNVPDLRGRFIRGVDGSANLDPDKASRTAQTTGGNTGNNVGSVQSDQFASHNHTTSGYDSGGGAGGYGTGSPIFGTTPTSSSGGNETRPENIYENFIIKAVDNSTSLVAETVVGLTMGANVTVDWNSGSYFTGQMTGDSTFSFSNVANGRTITLVIQGHASTNYTITFPTMIKRTDFTGLVKTGKYNIYTITRNGGNIFASCIEDMV